MQTRSTPRLSSLSLAAGLAIMAGAGALSPAPALASAPQSGPVIQRPICDFLVTQGTTSVFHPGYPDHLSYFSYPAAPPVHLADMDYTGQTNAFMVAHGGPDMGTQTRGSITERSNGDGSVTVTVDLFTTSALAWAVDFDTNDPNPLQSITRPVLFGLRPEALIANPTLSPALGDCHLRVVMTSQTPGGDIPDLVNAFVLGNTPPGIGLVSLTFTATSSGPLHAAFGVPEGTPGSCGVIQNGVFRTPFRGRLSDGFSTELVNLRAP